MVTIKNVYSSFSKDEFFTTEYFRLRLRDEGDIIELYYGDSEISNALVKKNNKEFLRVYVYRNRETIIKKYISEYKACHDFILFDFLKDNIQEDAHKIELERRCLFDMYEKKISSVDQFYSMCKLFGFPDKYISFNENPREETIIVEAFLHRITVDVVKNKRINICTLEGSINDNSMRLWVIVYLFWKLMVYKQKLRTIGIIEDDYSDSDIVEFMSL